MTLFAPLQDDWRLVLQAKATNTGCPYAFSLRLDEVTICAKFYTLSVSADWSQQKPENDDYYRKTSRSWMDFWTRGLHPGAPSKVSEHSYPRYEKVVTESLSAESHLVTVTDVQHEILARARQGAKFRTAHKEGGTTIGWNGNRFISSTYGDYPSSQDFANDEEFLTYVQQFFHMQTATNTYPERPSEFDEWKLLLRLLAD